MSRPSLVVPVLLTLFLAASTRADDPPPGQEPASVDESAVGRRVAELQREMESSSDWVKRCQLCIELADLQDRRAVAPLAAALNRSNPLVLSFALHGLARARDESAV